MTAAIRSITKNQPTYTIERNVPAPAKAGRNRKYPWNELNPGDAFVVDLPQSSASNIAYVRSKATGGKEKFTTRKVDENHTRIHRIA